MYRTLANIAKRFLTDAQIYKYGFNWSPMYRRTTAKIIEVSEDLHFVKIKIPLNWKNRNYVGTIFGGSMLSATDPIYMIQLMNILGSDYVVWDKAATINYRRPAKEMVFCDFTFSPEEIETIKEDVKIRGEIDVIKTPNIITKDGTLIAELNKIIYVADKTFYKKKRQRKAKNKKQ
jgi:acyl-coenzyme A thioesterase PaaI-like protein